MKPSFHTHRLQRTVVLALALANGIILRYAYTHYAGLYLLLLLSLPLLLVALSQKKRLKNKIQHSQISAPSAARVKRENITTIHN